MALHTSNLYGKIIINNRAIRTVAGVTALECYGIYGLSRRLNRDLTNEWLRKKKNFGKTVRVYTVGNRIYIDLNVILKYGVSADAVSESVRNAIKYNVEKFTGMLVECVNVNILGIKN